MSLHRNHLDICVESRLANTIKDGIDAVSARDLLDLGHHVAVRVHRPLRAILLCRRALLLRARRPDDLGAHAAQHLHQQRADAAGGRVHEHPLARLDIRRLAHKRPGRQALEERRGRNVQRQRLGHDNRLAGLHGRVLRVRAVLAAHVDNA